MLCGTKATRDYSGIRRFILDSEVGLVWKEGSDSVKEGVRLVEYLQHKQGSRAAAASLIRSLSITLGEGACRRSGRHAFPGTWRRHFLFGQEAVGRCVAGHTSKKFVRRCSAWENCLVATFFEHPGAMSMTESGCCVV